ncbi:ABC transporter permease [Staphylococcus warneri]|uniref:ABC transporter permease n=2 Tax=Staphylococcus warneri TaxID=1292 RepID=A0A6H3FHE9_STAWA|nr:MULTISPECIES: ABC transporter permease [Staphylococcus]AGC89514.1 membrane protein [Staphylococcus warneri SG1]PAK72553.1 ABC transporter permease [Staphylococcus pasteuri]COS99486.1 ABC-type transport system involved in multi-copper enzyme maturation%2C permease component [Streptococcus pneumoniae]EGG96684.1 conserved domain protein [Staphylococcus warneri VCU121]KEK49877.1 ABC-2 transporter family protein [Staphylococcus warneri Lyso 1 2011]
MINYMKSELYRIFHSKGLYIYLIVCNVLMILAALTLFYFDKTENNFPYGNAKFFYTNVITAGLLILVIGASMNMLVNSKQNKALNKISISFDTAVSSIYWGKFIVYILSFLVLSLISTAITVILGITLFDFDQTALTNYLIALVNMAPIVFGGLALAHAINSFKANLAIVIIIISIFYYQSAMILQVLTMISHKFDVIYDNSPTELFNQNFKEFMQESSQFGIHYWLIGVLLGLMFLIVGYLIYRNKEFID